jgi:hypothetical protein
MAARQAMETLFSTLPNYASIKGKCMAIRLRESASAFHLSPWKLSFTQDAKVTTSCAPGMLSFAS